MIFLDNLGNWKIPVYQNLMLELELFQCKFSSTACRSMNPSSRSRRADLLTLEESLQELLNKLFHFALTDAHGCGCAFILGLWFISGVLF